MTHRLPAAALAATAVLTVPLLRRMRRELESTGALNSPTVAVMYACYAGHAAATAQAARHRVGALPVPAQPATGAGVALMAGGASLCVAGMSRFASSSQISGTDLGQLATTGIYRYTRNPQYVGYLAFLAGLGLARRASAVLGLAGAAALVFRWWVPVEERHLERAFGDAYRRYHAASPRWLGRPRHRGNDMAMTSNPPQHGLGDTVDTR